jgi:hypothetical protein
VQPRHAAGSGGEGGDGLSSRFDSLWTDRLGEGEGRRFRQVGSGDFARNTLQELNRGDQSEPANKLDDRPLLAGGAHDATSAHTRRRTSTVTVEILCAVFSDLRDVFREYSYHCDPT